MLRRVTSSQSSLREEKRDAWKPPNAWVCQPTSKTPLAVIEDGILETADDPEQTDAGSSTDLQNLKQELERLADESNHIRLARLTRVWERLGNAPQKDVSVEEVQWMLSALHNLDDYSHFASSDSDSQGSISTATNKILALCETAGNAAPTCLYKHDHY
jgi:regulator of replication initiation timing